MADSGQNRERFQVAYIGDHDDDHTMDVEALGPALLAFGKLIRAANAELNQNRATMKVLVDSRFEHKCFLINFETLQTILDTVKDFLNDDGVKHAADVLQKLGVATGATATGLFGYLKWRNGRKVESAQAVKGSPGAVVIKVEGDNNTFQIGSDVFRLSQNAQILEAVEGTLTPIDRKEAKAIEFRKDDKQIATYRNEDVKAIVASCEDPGGVDPIEMEAEPKIVTAVLYTHSPVFDVKAPKWRFLYRKKPVYVDIRDTNIAKDAVKRGGSFMNDRYKVKMEITPPSDDQAEPQYKITEVLEFTPAEQQINMKLRTAKKKPIKKRAARTN
ncbi:hypothetical protein XI03_17195 [Bradyrhizobium sp. CCBAU 65884]|uniref:hypothetical protein n=1 Tax=Bradyrhizobium sp. CCBAU 65884 TaxID=722477 RepID=UPI002304E808|nr:hypothetical protein [Bradyrhizobium sp. CCBAU 65884]MDA9476213.1 hypothetical protein [Bradyrhizobium sp. CCBAU 65884]